MTFSQSPAFGTEQERTRALECMLEAEVRRTSKAARSILYEREFCWRGISISSMEDHRGLAAALKRAKIQEGREGGMASDAR